MMYVANGLFFILVILIALVVLLYFFRKQYNAVINPANLLWQQAMNEWNASPWNQKLQQNLLFWLQIAALTLLMLALAKPIWFSEGVKGEQIIWIVDTSATMSAMETDKPLIAQSKQQMKKMAVRLTGQEVTVIIAGEKPKILLSRETDAAIIQREIARLTVTYEHENIEKAVKLAESLVHNHDTVIHLFSDSVKKADLKADLTNIPYEIHNASGIQDNVAILSFGVAAKEKRISGLAVLENQGKKSKTFPFVITSDDSVVFQQEVTIPAVQQVVLNIPDLPEHRFYQASINAGDHYAADNELTAVYSDLNPTIDALGDVNPFFIKGLETLGIKTVQLDGKNSLGLKESGIILAEGLPVSELPKMPVIYMNKSNNQDELIELKEPIMSKDSPLTEYVDIGKTYIKYASKPIQGDWEDIVISGDHPLIQTGTINGQPAILMNFSLENTDWPLHPGFPIFLYNSYQWLSKQTGFLGYFQPGEEKWLQLDRKKSVLEIYNSAGESLSSIKLNTENFKAPYKPGIYQAVADEQVYYFSVLLDDREKKPETAPSFILNHSKTTDTELALKPNESLWFWLTLIVLALLMVEWEVYRKWL